jgi:hypothetical protein
MGSKKRSGAKPLRGTWWVGAASLAIPLVVVGISLFREPLIESEGEAAASSIRPTSIEVLGKSVSRSVTASTVIPGLSRGSAPRQAHRVTGSLPASAYATEASTTVAVSLPTASVPAAVSVPTAVPAAALPAWRLASAVSYASGAIKAKPLPRSVRPLRLRSAVTATATKVAANQFGGSLRPADVDVFFAEYDAPVGEWLGKVESVETEPRSVWFVVFTGMESKRATGVVRARDRAVASTTLSLDVTSDVVVVIDDDTGEVLVASEFLSENGGRYTRR